MEDRIPNIQNVVLLQTVMRLLGKDTSPATKKKLEVGWTVNLVHSCRSRQEKGWADLNAI